MDIGLKSRNVTRRKFIDWMIRGGICAGLGYAVVLEPNWSALERIDVPIPGLPKGLNGLRLGFMADFHRGRFVTEGDISRAVGRLQRQKPDLFLLGGDFVENKADYIHSCLKVLSKLEAPLGTYAVFGNHDYWADADIIRSAIDRTRVRLLDNESLKLKWHGEYFYLLGLDDAWEGWPNMKAALKGVDSDAMKILLVHEPDYADRIKNMPTWLPLQVSGHSHGGQVVLPFWGPPVLPYLGKKYPAGLQQVSGRDRWVYTTRGVGHLLPVRFNCKPEVTLLTLRKA
jgi:predicted MPP superfamily phosphohydrolase